MIILVGGKQRSGKDTIANYLVEKYNFTRIAFADKLKQVAKDLFFMKDKDRPLLIALGQKMREIDPDVWVKYIAETIDPNKDYVISDWRFLNEYFYLLKQGFDVISLKVYAPEHVRAQRDGYTEGIEDDISETNLDGFPSLFFLQNSGSLEELYKGVDDLVKRFKNL